MKRDIAEITIDKMLGASVPLILDLYIFSGIMFVNNKLPTEYKNPPAYINWTKVSYYVFDPGTGFLERLNSLYFKIQ